MSVYIFRDQSTGETVEEVHPSTDIPERVHRDGKTYVRDVIAEILSQHRTVREGSRYVVRHPHRMIESDSLAVHPDQIPEARALAAKRKVKIDFKADGTALFATDKQRQEYHDAHYGKKALNYLE